MNIQSRKNDATLSKEIFFYSLGDTSSPEKLLLHKKDRQRGSFHKYIIENVEKAQPSNLFNDFYEKIIEFKKLPVGWDGYNADPPNYEALTNALKTLNRLFDLGFSPTRIMPSVEGGISFLFIRNTKYADIECDNDGDIFSGMSDRTEEPILWQVNEKIHEKSLIATIYKISSFLGT